MMRNGKKKKEEEKKTVQEEKLIRKGKMIMIAIGKPKKAKEGMMAE